MFLALIEPSFVKSLTPRLSPDAAGVFSVPDPGRPSNDSKLTANGGGTMPANPDFRDLFAAFNAARVRYLLVGGYALAFHGRPRFTRDLDVWLEPDGENAARA